METTKDRRFVEKVRELVPGLTPQQALTIYGHVTDLLHGEYQFAWSRGYNQGYDECMKKLQGRRTDLI